METIKIINSEKISPIEANKNGIIITPILTPDDGAKWRSSIKVHLKKNINTKTIKLNSECVFFVLKGEGVILTKQKMKKQTSKIKKWYLSPLTHLSAS